MFNSAFDAFTDVKTEFYRAGLRAEIDAVNERAYHGVNNGVYRCGLASYVPGSIPTASFRAGRKITQHGSRHPPLAAPANRSLNSDDRWRHRRLIHVNA